MKILEALSAEKSLSEELVSVFVVRHSKRGSPFFRDTAFGPEEIAGLPALECFLLGRLGKKDSFLPVKNDRIPAPQDSPSVHRHGVGAVELRL